MAKLSDGKFILLWEEQIPLTSSFDPAVMTNGKVKYAFFDSVGTQMGNIYSMDGALSDCQPIVLDGNIIWYVTKNGGTPTFYQIDSMTHTSSSFTPVIGQKPSGIALPGEILSLLNGDETVYAAFYNDQGKLVEIAQGRVKGDKAVFSRNISKGWTLYFLDENSAPVCEEYMIK